MINCLLCFVAPLVYFLCATLTMVFITKKSFGKCLPLVMMLSAFSLFFSQLLFGTFNVGFVANILFAIAAVVFGVLQRKNIKKYLRLYFTSGLIVFLAIYVIVFVWDFARGFTVWDELSHWGMMLKEMFRLDKFYYVTESNLMVHKDYPPIMQLFELFWMKLSGGFEEASACRAIHTFELSLFVPFIAETILEKKKIIKNVFQGLAVTLLLLFTISILDINGVMHAIYTDYAMAAITAYLLLTIFVSKNFTLFEVFTLSIGGAFLLLLKQMGLPFYLLVLLFLFVIVLIRKKVCWKEFLKHVGIRKTLIYIVLLVIPFIFWIVWGRLTAGVDAQFDYADISISEFFNVFTGHGKMWQYTTIHNFIPALGDRNILSSWVQLSYLQCVVLFVGLAYLVFRLFRNNINKKEWVSLAIVLVVGAVGYAAGMLLLYITSFGDYEGPILASYDRYMSTYIMIMALVVTCVVARYFILSSKHNVIYGLLIALILLKAPASFSILYPAVLNDNNIYGVYKNDAVELASIINDADANIMLVSQKRIAVEGYQFFLQYYMHSYKIQNTWYAWPTGDNAREFYQEEVLSRAFNSDYLYVVDVDDDFRKSYCGLMKICPKSGEIYKIIRDNSSDNVKYEFFAARN